MAQCSQASGYKHLGDMRGSRQKPRLARLSRAYSVQRRNSKAPLVPPKPKEFDMAYSTLALRA
jgi:hypothetical protein